MENAARRRLSDPLLAITKPYEYPGKTYYFYGIVIIEPEMPRRRQLYRRNRQIAATLRLAGKTRGVVNMKRIDKTFHLSVIIAVACIWTQLLCCPAQALESGSYRLLSISETEKLVLVSRIPDQKKYLLDAADVKVTINGNPAEFSDLTLFTIVQVQMNLKKKKRKSAILDGDVREITISEPTEK